MAINIYTGVMGSGKSYECVVSVIVPAIASGRRVVTNIDGVNEEKIHEYIRKKKLADEEKTLGSIVHVKDEQVEQSGFFPDENRPEVETVVKGGDLIVIDEAWRFWSTGGRLSEEHMQFFRMHRHHVHEETKVSCDLALIFQSITDVHRQLRSVVEMTARTVKLKNLGLNSRYRVDLYGGDKVQSRALIRSIQRKYQKDVFPLYQSYTGGAGKELAIDNRMNILRSPLFVIGLIFGIGSIIFSIFFFVRFFSPKTTETVSAPANQIEEKPSLTVPTSYKQKQVESGDLRLAGKVFVNGARLLMVVDGQGRYRYVDANDSTGSGVFQTVEVNGQEVSRFSGSAALSDQE